MPRHRSNATGVHFACIFLLTLCVILGAVAYLSYSDLSARQKELAGLRKEVNHLRTSLSKAHDDESEMHSLLGYKGEHERVIERVEQSLADHVGEPLPESVRAAIKQLAEQLRQSVRTRDALIENKRVLEGEIAKTREEMQARLNVESEARRDAARDLADAMKSHDEAMSRLRDRIESLGEEIRSAETEIAERGKTIDELRRDMSTLERNSSRKIAYLNQKLKQNTSTQFEKPDGKILAIDSYLGMVWIDLGSNDHLETGLRMNVYAAAAGKKRKRKGVVQVIKIDGPRLAQAKILDDSRETPILKGDFVHTPLWSAGRERRFAFAGVMDLDGDGKPDNTRLHAFVRASGAKVHAYVDDAGQRVGQRLDGTVKNLVIGSVPDPTREKRAEDEQMALSIVENVTSMKREAEDFGIEVISLTEFLDRVGFRASGTKSRRPAKRNATPSPPTRSERLRSAP